MVLKPICLYRANGFAVFRSCGTHRNRKLVLRFSIEPYESKPVYCAFVDYRKAFDMIDRSSLWQKLLKLNIKGKVLNVIINAYNGAKSCVKLNRSMSDYFSCNIGVRQGENLSPLLFAIYLNDLETYFVGNCNGINLATNNDEADVFMRLFTLLYADDTILLSESSADLQNIFFFFFFLLL